MQQPSTFEKLTGQTLDERWHVLYFDLRLGSRYHTERRRFFLRLHQWFLVLSTVLGSATFVALLAEAPKALALSLSAVVAFGTGLDAVIGFAARANTHADLARRFIELESSFLKAECNEVEFANLQSLRRAVEADEPPPMPLLIRRCHRELMRHDGHEETRWPEMTRFQRWFAQLLPHT